MEYAWDIARENMKNIRLKNKLTIEELAKEINWSRSSIGGYEIGKRVPTITYIIDFCNYFGLKIENLFKREEQKWTIERKGI